LTKANKNTLLITSTRPLPPFTVAIGQAPYPDVTEVLALIRKRVKKLVAFDGQELAEKAKNPLSLNMVMLGALFAAGELGIPVKSIKKMIRQQGKKKFTAANLEAFDLGFKAAGGN